MTCKLCGSQSSFLFSEKVLGRYNASYYRCQHCHLVQPSPVTWLSEAYSSAITGLDLGLPSRNNEMVKAVIPIIDACYPNAKHFVDYAGGYGLFTRLMRDAGFEFFREDRYCENLFARHFDVSDSGHSHFDLLTAFEVAEHFEDPAKGFDEMFALADDIIFSTEVYDGVEDLRQWWYLAPETGQHIAFYGTKTLGYIAARHGKHYYSSHGKLHLFSSRAFTRDQLDYAFGRSPRPSFFGLVKRGKNFKIGRESLLQKDFEMVRDRLRAQEKKQ